jgi:hypothetical protein
MASKFGCSYGILLDRRGSGAWSVSFPPLHLQATGLSDSLTTRHQCTTEVCLSHMNHIISLVDIAISGANAALLMYDITNASTFEDIRGWLQGNSSFNVLKSEADPPLRY